MIYFDNIKLRSSKGGMTMLDYFENLAILYNVHIQNVVAIALNRYGIICKELDDNRLRFNLRILGEEKPTFFAVCVNTYLDSPFELRNDKLYLEDVVVGEVSNIEKDTCTSTYFRNNKKAITLNSNSRSKCVGCKFCGTYSLSEDDAIDFSSPDKVQEYFGNLLKANNIPSMRNIENITVCTGCFENEDALVKHLLDLRKGTENLDFNGSINYIGSQLRDYDKIKLLKDTIGDFGIYLTIEKFLDREKFMKREKASLTLEKARDLLEYSSSIGVTSTFLYILGLENLETLEKYMNYFKESINKFPIVQVFQDYTPEQEKYRCKEAHDVEYYLRARQIMDEIFRDTELSPKLWECFRSLYHAKDNGETGNLKRCLRKH